MRLSKFDSRFKANFHHLASALARLEEKQGRQARLNARAAVWTEVKCLRTLVERYFPVIPKAPPMIFTEKPARRRSTAAQRGSLWVQKMKRRGYGPVQDTNLQLNLAEAGVRVVRAPLNVPILTPYAPLWAIVGLAQARARHGARVAIAVAEVRRLRRGSNAGREAVLASARLGGHGASFLSR